MDALPVSLAIPAGAPDFVTTVTAQLIAGNGELLPVSALPPDGTFPTATAQYEKRALAPTIPIWDPSICIDCGKCAIVCPHSSIRMTVFPDATADAAPAVLLHKAFKSRELPGHSLAIAVAPDDCTGCALCVDVCPAHSKENPEHKSIDMADALAHRDAERARWEFFERIPDNPAHLHLVVSLDADRFIARLDKAKPRDAQFFMPAPGTWLQITK